MNNLPHLNEIDKIELLAVLGHSNKSAKENDPMSFDARVRCRAAGILCKHFEVNQVVLLGGGNDKVLKVAEGERMRKYLKRYFEIDESLMEVLAEGTNTITDLVEIIKKIEQEKIRREKVVLVTSEYNSVRVKMVLELLGQSKINVFSSERILLDNHDSYSDEAGKYLQSEEFQERLLYEAYWCAKTVYDLRYTKQAREELNIEQSPLDYYKAKAKCEMENIDRA